tara:strand:+ start:880 stop:1080 length:201 start_codon:yes stop_codon:yes gene_type:complete
MEEGMKNLDIKIQDLSVGMETIAEGSQAMIVFIYEDRFDVQYLSGSLGTYRIEDFDCGKIYIKRWY